VYEFKTGGANSERLSAWVGFFVACKDNAVTPHEREAIVQGKKKTPGRATV
jgi:hypothetical protein